MDRKLQLDLKLLVAALLKTFFFYQHLNATVIKKIYFPVFHFSQFSYAFFFFCSLSYDLCDLFVGVSQYENKSPRINSSIKLWYLYSYFAFAFFSQYYMKIEFRIVLRSRFGLCGGKVKEKNGKVCFFYVVLVVADKKNKCLKAATKEIIFYACLSFNRK